MNILCRLGFHKVQKDRYFRVKKETESTAGTQTILSALDVESLLEQCL